MILEKEVKPSDNLSPSGYKDIEDEKVMLVNRVQQILQLDDNFKNIFKKDKKFSKIGIFTVFRLVFFSKHYIFQIFNIES